MAAVLPADLVLEPVGGAPRTLREWTTTFHLVVVAVDPYTYESAWILDTALRVLREFRGADCRVGWLVTGDATAARRFLGPLSTELLTFTDPDRAVVGALGLAALPALVHVAMDGSVDGTAEGWDPHAWKQVCDQLTDRLSWGRLVLPSPRDPAPYPGTPALG